MARPHDPDYSQLAALADRLLAPVILVAPDSTILYANCAATRPIGAEPGWLIGRKMLELIHPEDRARVRRQLSNVVAGRPAAGITRFRVRADAARDWRVFESIADNVLDVATMRGILVSSRDVSDQIGREQQLSHVAFHDSLTGLPNRAKITEHLDLLLAGHVAFTLALVGIDRFDLINGSLGHSVGNAVLQAASGRIALHVPDGTFVARVGGATFALILTEPIPADPRAFLWNLVDRLGEPLFISGHELRLSASAGAVRREDGATRESLPLEAGLAFRRAKSRGGGRVEMFSVDMRDEATNRLELEADLRRALASDEFFLALQPVVQLDTGETVATEALVRWNSNGQVMSPVEFIPIAEETGMMVPLGDWIIDQAAKLAVTSPGDRVIVNLSARQLGSPGVVNQISRALARHQLPASRFAFEITETMLVEDFDYTIQVLTAIQALGCLVGLDDFGTGYSSFAYLRRLPIDFLKIDASLTADVDTDLASEAIVAAIVAMAKALGIETVAEGVETEAQAAVLRRLGCILGQGFYFGRPVEHG